MVKGKENTNCYKRNLDVKKQNCKKAKTEAYLHCYGLKETAVKADCEEAGGKTLARTGHFRVPPGLCFKTRVGAQPLIC